jgi:hypothetical protein
MRLMHKTALVCVLSSWVVFGGTVQAGVLSAEAGGPKQHERAVREWATERERAGHERPDRPEARPSGSAQNTAPKPAEKASPKTADVRNLPALTITKEAARRQEIKDVTGATLGSRGRQMVATSEHRDNSPAHQNGAIDFRSKDLSPEDRHHEAKAVSKALGSHHTVVVEEPHAPAPGAEGPKGQVNTAYRDGKKGNTRVTEIKASATHTHVQPDVPKKASATPDVPKKP